MAFRDGVMGFVLAVMALSLGGCGSSGSPSPSPPPPPPEAPADFVSQSVHGFVSASVLFENTTVEIPPQPFAIYVDADKIKVRAEGQGTLKEADLDFQGKAILDVPAKRVTYYYNGTLGDQLKSNCSYINVKKMPDPEMVRQLIKLGLGELQPTKAADGNKQLTGSLDLSQIPVSPQPEGTVKLIMELGEDNTFQKVNDLDVELKKPVEATVHATVNTTLVTAGTPDATKFEVDKTWGDCKEITPPHMYDDLNDLPAHVSLPIKMMLSLLQIKEESTTEKQSKLIAI